jgi:hypothetical protein
MRLGSMLTLFVHGVLWRVTKAKPFGHRLIEGLAEQDENARSVAGIMLAKSGRAAIPILREALSQRRGLAEKLILLGDVGDVSVEADIAAFAADPDADIAKAAQGALRVLAFRKTT